MSPVTGRPLIAIGILGFASGLPLFLTFFTLQQWMSEAGVSLRTIGLAASIGLPYLLKFLWSPLLDRMPPGALSRLGRRRGWLLPLQFLLTGSILLMAGCDPKAAPLPLVFSALALAFFSASQDVVIDAWRIESYPAGRQAAALSFYVWGYRLAMQVSGAGAIWLAGRLGWHGSYLVMALLSLVGVATTLAVGEPEVARTALAASGSVAAELRSRIAGPLADLLRRPGSGYVIGFVMLFNLGTQIADTMAAPYYHRLGFSRDAVAFCNGLPLLAAALAGAAASAWLVGRIGGSRTLILAAFAQMASMSLYLALWRAGPAVTVLLAKVTVEGFAEALAQTTLLTYLSRLCSARYTATQYALLSSLPPVAWRTLGGATGVMAQSLGWPGFYTLAILCALPGIAIMLHLLRRFPDGLPPQSEPAAAG